MTLIIFLVSYLSLSSGLVFDCFYDLELFFDDVKLLYTCSLPDGSLDKGARVKHTNATHRDILEVTGPHVDGQNNTHVKQIHIYKHQFEYFPRGLTNYFENIEAIHAGMNNLAYLEKDDMKVFSKLRFLYLYNNVLSNLQSDVLEDNTKLEYVSFYNNHLAHIGSRLLTPLKSLKTAYFNKNICIDKQAVHNAREIHEIKLEISERCSDITDEDLLTILKQNQEKIASLEEKIAQMSDQLNEFVASNRTEF